MANPHIGLVDARLNLLALMEGLVRSGMPFHLLSTVFQFLFLCDPTLLSYNDTGTANWECSAHIANASEEIIRHLVVPNLVWRVGEYEVVCL